MVGRLEWSLPWAGNPGCFMEGSTTFGSVIFILFYSIIEVGLLWQYILQGRVHFLMHADEIYVILQLFLIDSYLLVINWSNSFKMKNNPLNILLFSPNDIEFHLMTVKLLLKVHIIVQARIIDLTVSFSPPIKIVF